jgi:C-terminal processing protease CtpA/Prc
MSLTALVILAAFPASLPAQEPAAGREPDEARRVVRERTGLTFSWLESLIRRSIISTDTPYGFKVNRVIPGSPAGKAGIRPGDVILEWDGRPLRSLADLRGWFGDPEGPRTIGIARARPGKRAPWRIEVVRFRLRGDDGNGTGREL